MKPVAMTVLSAQDVQSLNITFTKAVELIEVSFTEHANKRIENPPKPGVHSRPASFIHAMPALLSKLDVIGIKWVSGYPANREKGLPTIFGVIVLNDADTGLPTAVMDGTWITNVRTAAATAAAAKRLVKPGATTLGVVGTGVQGIYNTLCLAAVIPSLTTVYAHDAFAPSLDKFCAAIAEKAPKLKVIKCESSQDAIAAGDVVVCATSPLGDARTFHSDWLKPGCACFPIHAGGWEEGAMVRYKLITDDWGQFKSFCASKYTMPEAPYAETGEIIAGMKAGRDSADEIIINCNAGLAIHDMVFADYIHKEAKAKGLGCEIVIDNDASTPAPIPSMM